jgi:exopolysaccharide production protein ExoY
VRESTTIGGVGLVAAVRASDSRRYRGPWRYAKRGLDLLIVVLGLPFALVVGAAIAIAIKTTSSGPVFFRQVRTGQDGRHFRMMKFRSMQVDAEKRLRADPDLLATYLANDHKLPADEDPRMTGVGRWIRRRSLDELPQLWNVLTGAMSLVGPRPVTPEQLRDWGERSTAYLSMKPGLTGLWQINGRSWLKLEDRVAYDESYLAHWSIWLDLRLLVLTPVSVLAARGAH